MRISSLFLAIRRMDTGSWLLAAFAAFQFPSMEGWQAQPRGVVAPACAGFGFVTTTAPNKSRNQINAAPKQTPPTTPRLRRTPPREGNWPADFNWQALRVNAGKDLAKCKAFTPNPFLVFFLRPLRNLCALCVLPPYFSTPRINRQ